MSFPAKGPRVILFRGFYLRIPLSRLVFRRSRRHNHRGVHYRARLDDQAMRLEMIPNPDQKCWRPLRPLQPIAEFADRGLIRHTAGVHSGNHPDQRHLLPGLLHGGIRISQPRRHEVKAPHRVQRHGEGRPNAPFGSCGSTVATRSFHGRTRSIADHNFAYAFPSGGCITWRLQTRGDAWTNKAKW